MLNQISSCFEQEQDVNRIVNHKKCCFFSCFKFIIRQLISPKIHELGLELLSHPPCCSDLAPAIVSCSQISKKCSLGRNFLRMMRRSPKLRSILKERRNRTTKMTSKSWRVGMCYPWRELKKKQIIICTIFGRGVFI